MAQKKKQDMFTGGQKVGIGIGMTAAVLGAVGGYFLYGAKDAEKNRKKVGSWMLKAKGEVLEAIENAKELTEADYSKAVDDVMKGYKAAKTASVKELAEFAHEMKDHWKQIKHVGEKKKAVIAVKKATQPKKKAKAKAK